jgi:hypothetical protein
LRERAAPAPAFVDLADDALGEGMGPRLGLLQAPQSQIRPQRLLRS